MKRFFTIMLLIMFSAGMIFAQENVTKQPNKPAVATAKPVTKSNTTQTNSGDSNQGSTTTKGDPNSSTTTTSTKANTTEPNDSEVQGSSATKGNSSSTATTSTQTVSTVASDTTPASTSNVTLDHFIIGGGISAGALISTDIISTGGILGLEFEAMVQFKHHRLGIGGDKTLMLNLRNLGTVIGTLGKSNCNLNKVYFIYEWTLFKRSPINFTAGFKVGSFDVGKSTYRTEQEENNEKATKSPFFASVGLAFEVGHPRFLLYIKPEIGFHSYDTGSWRKDIYAMATVGFRWKTKRLDKYDSSKAATEPEKKFE